MTEEQYQPPVDQESQEAWYQAHGRVPWPLGVRLGRALDDTNVTVPLAAHVLHTSAQNLYNIIGGRQCLSEQHERINRFVDILGEFYVKGVLPCNNCSLMKATEANKDWLMNLFETRLGEFKSNNESMLDFLSYHLVENDARR